MKVQLNEHMSLDIDMPEKMDASELVSLLDMAKKIANIAPAQPGKTDGEPRQRKPKKNIGWWSKEENTVFQENWDWTLEPADNIEVIQRLLPDRSMQSIYSKYYYQREQRRIADAKKSKEKKDGAEV